MKKVIITLLLISLIPILGYVGFKSFKSWSQTRLVLAAQKYVKAGDFRNASLSAQRAIQINGNNLPACQLMAELAEAARSPHALYWRKRVVELDPNSMETRIALARAAITRGEFQTAKEAMDGIPEKARANASYEKTMGSLASAQRNITAAEAHFKEALRLVPNDPTARYNLGTLELLSTNKITSEKGRIALKELTTDATLHLEAWRELAWDAIRQSSYSNATECIEALLKEKNPAFVDRILNLEVLNRFDKAQLPAAIAATKPIASTNASALYQLSEWLGKNNLSKEALEIILSTSLEIRTNMPIPIVMSDAYAALGDWDGLLAALDRQNWDELEYFRHAIRAKAFLSKGEKSDFQNAWRKATALAGRRLEFMMHLSRLALAYRWNTEAIEILSNVVNVRPTELAAVNTLNELLVAQGDTRRLQQLYAKISETTPTDLKVKNNLALATMLLDPKSKHAYDLAEDLYAKQPENPVFVSTYAFSLHLQNKDQEALQVFRKLNGQKLEIPSVATYYGLILAATGDKTNAPKYLDLALKNRLLPEEAQLIKQARL